MDLTYYPAMTATAESAWKTPLSVALLLAAVVLFCLSSLGNGTNWLLHDLATESDAKGRLSGVRAIALYPLNALIASQKERLRAWTRPFGGKVRFGLYNGLTPDKLRASDMRHAEQAQDRETLRRDPPPILVTNVTMLEYMTIRRIDRPLIENSRGQLRWIILDEAHGYVGSAAAEIALLIRRVLLAFGVKASDVRFVATSATIGDGKDVTDDLRRFLQDISGAEADRIHVVTGAREPLMLPKADAEARAEQYVRFRIGAVEFWRMTTTPLLSRTRAHVFPGMHMRHIYASWRRKRTQSSTNC